MASWVLARINRRLWYWLDLPQALWVSAALALAIRLAIVFALQDWRDPESWEYGMIAANMMAGEGFSGSAWFLPEGPTAFMAPGYVWLLYGALTIFGGAGYAVLQVFQSVCGALAVLLVYRLAEAMFCRRTPPAAALVVACNPVHAYISVLMHPLAVTVALLMAVVYLLYRLCTRGGWRRALLLGLVYGIGLLTEPALLCIAPLILGAPWLAGNSQRLRFLGCGAAAFACALLVVSPWTARNYHTFDRFVLIKSAFGYILWAGNHEGAPGTQTFVNAEGEADHVVHHVPEELLDEIEGMSEPDAYNVFAREAIEYMAEHPGTTLAMTMKKALYYWWFPTWLTSPSDANAPLLNQFRRPEKIVWLAVLLSGIPGLWFARRAWRRWALVIAVLACFTALYAVTTVSNGPRYRIPVEPLVMIFSGVTLRRMVDRESTE